MRKPCLVHSADAPRQAYRRAEHCPEISKLPGAYVFPHAPGEPVALLILALQVKSGGGSAITEKEPFRIRRAHYAELRSADYRHRPAESAAEVFRRLFRVAACAAPLLRQRGIVDSYDCADTVLDIRIHSVLRIVEELHGVFSVGCEKSVLHTAPGSVRVVYEIYRSAALQRRSHNLTASHTFTSLRFTISYICADYSACISFAVYFS